jgi:hypothetical protein
VGKTQLAVEYAWKHLERYEGVLFWVRADNPEALATALAEFAGVLGLPEARAKEQTRAPASKAFKNFHVIAT